MNNLASHLNKLNFQFYAILSASWISTGACAYIAYVTHCNTNPKPVIDIEQIDDATRLVRINSITNGTLKDTKIVHRNLDCLQKKGYIVKRICDVSYEPMLHIEAPINSNNIANDCKACEVATEIEYATLFGRRKEILEWVPEEAIKVQPRPTHKQQNPPAALH